MLRGDTKNNQNHAKKTNPTNNTNTQNQNHEKYYSTPQPYDYGNTLPTNGQTQNQGQPRPYTPEYYDQANIQQQKQKQQQQQQQFLKQQQL